MKNKIKKYIGPMIVAIVIFVTCMFANGGVFGKNNAETLLYGLSNCFTIPGIILTGIAAIGWAGKFGTFDMLSYGMRSFFGIFIKPLSNDMPTNFYEYRKQKDEDGRKWSPELLLVGLAFLLMGVIFTVISFVI